MNKVKVTSRINEVDERSEQVREILGQPPSWPIRWGTTLLFVILVLGGFLAYLIKYPDTILGQVAISTQNPPIRMVAPAAGQIEALFVEDGQQVEANDYLAEIQNATSETTIRELDQIIQATEAFLDKPKATFELSAPSNTLGDAQSHFNILLKDVRDYTSFLADNYYSEQISTLQKQINNYQQLTAIAAQQQKLTAEDLEQARQRFETQKQLYEEGLIAKLDFLEEESRYIQVKQAFEAIQKEEVQNDINIYNNKRQIEQLEFDFRDRERQFQINIQQSLLSLKNYIQDWEQRNVFVAPISGKVSFLKRIAPKQYVENQEELFAIVPSDSNHLAVVSIPATGYGKVQVGQSVRIQLNNYPQMQFGSLVGKVVKLSSVPNQDAYFAEVMLTQGLRTTYNKDLEYHPEMTGIAEIITEDLSLIERIFYKIKEIFDR